MLYKAIELPSEEPVQYVGCYVLKWGKVDQPSLGFVPAKEENEELKKLREIAEAVRKLHAYDDLEEPWDCPMCSPINPTMFNAVRRELYLALVEWMELENVA